MFSLSCLEHFSFVRNLKALTWFLSFYAFLCFIFLCYCILLSVTWRKICMLGCYLLFRIWLCWRSRSSGKAWGAITFSLRRHVCVPILSANQNTELYPTIFPWLLLSACLSRFLLVLLSCLPVFVQWMLYTHFRQSNT